MRKSAIKGGKNRMTKNYLHSPMAPMKGSVRSASCRCRLIIKNIRFLHAAALGFVMAVFTLISRATEKASAHSVELQRRIMKKVTGE